MRRPVDVPTRATAAFIASHVPAGASILEIGCGEGHLARELAGRGYAVTGIDCDADAAARARERGVAAVVAAWPDFACEPVDAAAFTRSLHHIGALGAAVRRARDLVRPGGTILVEDFAFDGADERTIAWFVGVLRSRDARSLLAPVPGAFVTDLLASRNPVEAWRESHDHELHTVAAMTSALEQELLLRASSPAAYLYRYLVPVVPESDAGAAFVQRVLDEETRLGERGELALIGRRLVAERSRTGH